MAAPTGWRHRTLCWPLTARCTLGCWVSSPKLPEASPGSRFPRFHSRIGCVFPAETQRRRGKRRENREQDNREALRRAVFFVLCACLCVFASLREGDSLFGSGLVRSGSDSLSLTPALESR